MDVVGTKIKAYFYLLCENWILIKGNHEMQRNQNLKKEATFSCKTKKQKTAAAAVMRMFVFTAVAVNFKTPPRTFTNGAVMKLSVSSQRRSLLNIIRLVKPV